MSEGVELALRAVLIGVAGTVCMDLWAIFLRRAFGVRSLDYGLLGRWIGHVPRGRFVHERIAAAAPVPGERALGWVTHYTIGVSFAAVLLGVWGLSWARSPTLGPALVVGMGTLVAPLFVMQPCMGLGVAASKTPRPWAARVKSVGTHLVYGLGVYGAGVVLARVWAGG